MGKYFGTDGVRGEANKELTPELAFKLGRYGGYVLSQHETGDRRPRVLVGRDTRIDRWTIICRDRGIPIGCYFYTGCCVLDESAKSECRCNDLCLSQSCTRQWHQVFRE